jgi:F0F1-type ATP synthase epsilon subunit
MDTRLLTVTIKKPGETIFSGTASAVSSVTDRGKFDILPLHANFIALIKEVVTIHQHNQKPTVIPIKTGVLKVKENIVKIILGIETQTTATN